MTSRLPRLDPWGPLVTGAGLVVFLLHGFAGGVSRDVALYAYSAEQLADGVPPYVAVLNRAGPFAHLVPGVGVAAGRVLGLDDLLAARITLMLVSLGCVWVGYLLGRDLFGSRLAGVAGASTLLAFHGFVDYATWGPREKTTMVLFVLLALWAVTRRRWVAAGAVIALATLTWQPAFLTTGVAALTAALLLPNARDRLAALVRIAAGGIAVTALTTAYFAAVGALPELYEGFLRVNLGYTTQTGLFGGRRDKLDHLLVGYGWSLGLAVAGLAALLGIAATRLRHLDRTDGSRCGTAAAGAALVASLLWTLVAFQGWPDFFVFLPLAATGVAGLAGAAATQWPAWGARAVAGLCVGLLVVTAAWSAASRTTGLTELRTTTRSLLRTAGPEATILSVNAPQPLAALSLDNPLRDQMYDGGLDDYLDATHPGGLAAIAGRIERLAPTFISVEAPRRRPWLADVLRRDYVRLGVSHDTTFVWFARADLPAQQLRQLRDRLRERRSGTATPRVGSSPR